MEKNITMVVVGIVFLLGLYICLNYTSRRIETMANPQYSCPDIIVKKGNKLFLKKSGKAEIPGINPIEFNNLEEYVEFLQWQRSQGIHCPVLFLEESYNAQGDRIYKMRPNMFYPQGGLNSYNPEDPQTTTKPLYEESKMIDASRDDPPYNSNAYPGFDQQNQYIGLEVPIDKLFHQQEQNVKSDNPMDANWGGVKYSEASVKTGKYSGSEVDIWVD
jgi:hypothetical protein